jgi:aspartate beta-hydroxylase
MASRYDRAGAALRRLYDWRIHTPPILDPQRFFPDGRKFAAAWQPLRDEALAVARKLDHVPRLHEIMREQSDISASDGRDWRMFVVKEYGAKIPKNLVRCPTLAGLLDACPQALSACFSYLAPGKDVPVHRGPFRGIMRFHLGLSMPRDGHGELGSTLWVNGIPCRLDNGETLLWDDTYPHAVSNATDQVRVALLLDVWRPEMPADMAALSYLIVRTVRTFASLRVKAFTAVS